MIDKEILDKTFKQITEENNDHTPWVYQIYMECSGGSIT